jgi:hypothetical protein
LASETILSQDAIDALLNSASEGSVDAPVGNPIAATQLEDAPESVETMSVVAAQVVEQPSGLGLTRDEAIEIAGEAAEAEALPIQNSMNRISQRVDAMEAALARIADLEHQVSWLRKML